MKKRHYKTPVIILLLYFCLPVYAEDETTDDMELLNELRNLHEAYGYVESASKFPQKQDQAPGVITIVTEQEILNSGARDLIDVLRLVPGFDFGVDTFNVVGSSIRGNWAYEGNMLLMIDGLEMNERRYGTTQFGHHYPIDNIQKIEVVRGPGSVMYGGFAKLGVINIITKTAHDKQGISIVGRYGQMHRSNGHQALNVYAGKKLTDDLHVTAAAKITNAHRSDQFYTDVYGQSANLANINTSENIYANLSVQYKDFALRFLMDDYKIDNIDGFVKLNDRIVKSFKTYIVDLKYQYQVTDTLKLNLKFNYSNQLPWTTKNFINEKLSYIEGIASERYLGSTRFDYTPNSWLQMTGGLEFSHEAFENLAGQRDIFHAQGFENYLSAYQNWTAYLESLFKSDWGNLTLGLRYDKHNTFESNLAPRAAFTDSIGNFHYKLLYSNSFRTPTIENFLFSENYAIKPSRTKAYEIELGYQFNPDLSIKTNAFYLSSKDMIIYGTPVGAALLQYYYNANTKINSVGVETELRWKQDWGYINFNHSYSQIIKNFKDYQPINTLTNAVVNSDMSLAFPAHKFTLNSHINLTPSLSINPSLIVSSSRYGYNAIDDNANLLLHKYHPEVLGNVYFRYKDVLVKDLELGFGVYDLFGAKHQFIQPYNGGHAPLPDRSREFIFKVSYQL